MCVRTCFLRSFENWNILPQWSHVYVRPLDSVAGRFILFDQFCGNSYWLEITGWQVEWLVVVECMAASTGISKPWLSRTLPLPLTKISLMNWRRLLAEEEIFDVSPTAAWLVAARRKCWRGAWTEGGRSSNPLAYKERNISQWQLAAAPSTFTKLH